MMTNRAVTQNRGLSFRRVLILVENLSVPFDRRVWKECRTLSAAGYQVTVVSPKGAGRDQASYECVDGVAIHRYAPHESSGSALSYALEYGVALAMMSWLAWKVFFGRGFDVIQICNPPDLLVLVALPFRIFGKAIIFDQHDLSPEIYAARREGGGGTVHRLLLAFERLTYRCSDVVVCITQSVCQVARERGRVPEGSLFLVRNGPDLSSFADARADEHLRRGRRFLLSYVGMMGPQDGVDVLLRCVRILRKDLGRNDFHVHVVGGGTELDFLRAYAIELGVRDCVTFAGQQPYEHVVTAIASADVCACPDPKTPLNDMANLVKVSEYLSLGRPVVAFDLTEVRHSAAGAALYATSGDERDFAEKIAYLFDHPDERTRMGRIGLERVHNLLCWDHSKRALLAAYDRACGASPAVSES
jgi:glycosyltransferase involved in cell wall biosynthesis